MSLPDVIKKLKGIQVREGLTDDGMAKQLGCSRQLYQGTRSGNIPLGNKLLKGISTAFPELQNDVIYFLSNNDKKLSNPAKVPHKSPQDTLRGLKQGIKGFFVGLLARIRK